MAVPRAARRERQEMAFRWQVGIEELRLRQIGRNELLIIEACHGYVDAQQEYAETDHDGDGLLEFAARINSAPGQQDGLYWSTAEGEDISPVGPFLAQAVANEPVPGNDREPLAGYMFRVLTSQGSHAAGGAHDFMVNGNLLGGFALVAWPVKYGATGIKTFIVNQQGQIFEKDLGAGTSNQAAALQSFDPDPSWTFTE
jgi:hypothetical protein